MAKNLYIILAVAAVLSAIGAWQMLGRQSADESIAPETGAPGISDVVVSEPAIPEAETRNEPDAPGAMSPAKRIRHGTARGQDLANASFDLPPSGNEKSDRLRKHVEAALDGDIDELIGVSRAISRCGRGMGSEAQVQARLDRMSQFISRNPDAPIYAPRGGSGGPVQFESVEDMEAEMWAQFDECQVVRNVMDETLYEQVSRLAESGVASARYLYAVWPPDQDSLLAVDTLELLEYQSLALEYTWMNMQERDPLGLLAMSQSYGANRPSMFTPRSPLQSQVFRLASMKCGIDNEWLTNRAADFGQGFGRFEAEHTEMPSLDEDAAALAEMFCPLEEKSD